LIIIHKIALGVVLFIVKTLEMIQKFRPKKKISLTKTKVYEFIVDEILIIIGMNLYDYDGLQLNQSTNNNSS
jgi:hypothetical protein